MTSMFWIIQIRPYTETRIAAIHCWHCWGHNGCMGSMPALLYCVENWIYNINNYTRYNSWFIMVSNVTWCIYLQTIKMGCLWNQLSCELSETTISFIHFLDIHEALCTRDGSVVIRDSFLVCYHNIPLTQQIYKGVLDTGRKGRRYTNCKIMIIIEGETKIVRECVQKVNRQRKKNTSTVNITARMW